MNLRRKPSFTVLRRRQQFWSLSVRETLSTAHTEDDYDPIVGKMTVAQLDKELKNKEGDAPSPGYDPDEADRIQALLDRDRPGVRLLLDTTLDALQNVKQGFDSGAT